MADQEPTTRDPGAGGDVASDAEAGVTRRASGDGGVAEAGASCDGGCPETIDPVSSRVLSHAAGQGVETVWDRHRKMHPRCSFGRTGVCCRACHMGPCRITSKKTPLGVCGADADTIVARNYVREICGGVSAHSDHGRHLVRLLRRVLDGEASEPFRITDEEALEAACRFYGVKEPRELPDALMREFGDCEAPLRTLERAPEPTRKAWERLGIVPRGIDASVVEMMHRTTMGVDQEGEHLVHAGMRAALADGWGGSMIATLVSDILFGTPRPLRSRANLGVLKADHVNVVVHGHEPSLTEMLAAASRDPEVLGRARERGAAGIQLAGICCTANEMLMRHGIPIAGNFLQQELALATGAVDMMVVDVQCIMASLERIAGCYHTKVYSTSPLARMSRVEHLPFQASRGYEDAKQLLMTAVEAYGRRDPERVNIPDGTTELVAGFSNRTIFHMLGGRFRASYRPLTDAIIQGRIRGVCGVVGCSNPKIRTDSSSVALVEELIRNDVLVLQTGCAAIASAKAGLLTPETAARKAGPGLAEVCEAVGIPPVLHMGSCVDNSRLLEACTHLVDEGGLGESIADLPVAGAAPEWMSEKAVAIGTYFVASGVLTVLGQPLFTEGSEAVTRLLTEGVERQTGGRFAYIEDPHQAAAEILAHIDHKREALGIHRKFERKLLDMKDRRG